MAEYDIGESFVRIVPSFRGVAESIDREAAKWGASAGAKFSETFNERVKRDTDRAPLGPSDDKSREQGGKSAGKFADAFKARLAAAMRSLPDIKVNADSSEADKKLAELRAQMAELGKRVGVDLNDKDALAKLAELQAALEKLGSESDSVAVKMNTAAARAEIDRLRAEIDKIQNPVIKPDVDTKPAKRKIAELRADGSKGIQLNLITGPAMAGIHAIRTALLGLSAGAAVTPLVGVAGALLGPALGAGLGGAGVAAVVKNAQTKVSAAEKLRQQAQASSPGQRQALQNRAASLQAQAARAETAAQAKGASAATKQRASQLQQQAAAAQKAAQGPTAAQQKANAAMAGLTPQEQAFAKAQETLKTSFTSWASSLERYVLPVVTRAMRLIGPLLDEIRPLVITVSHAVGQVLSQVRQGMKSAGLDEFVFTLNSLAGPAIRTVATVLGNIGSAAGTAITKLAPMAGAVEGLLTGLTGRLAKAAKGSGLGQFVKTITGTLPTLTKTLGDIGGLVAHLLGALAPLAKPVLSVVDQLARSLSGLVKDVGPSLTALFRALAPAVNSVLRVLEPVAALLVRMVARALVALLPALRPLAQAFASLVRAVAPILPVIGQLIGTLLPPLVRFLGKIFDALAPVIKQFAAQLGPVLPQLAKALGDLLTALLPLLPPLAKLISAALNLAVNVLSKLLIPVIEHVLVPVIKHVLVPALNFLITIITHVIDWIANHLIPWFSKFVFNMKMTSDFVKRIWNDMWKAVKGAWDATASFFADRWKSFTGTVSHAWHAITGAVSGAWRGMVGGLKTAWRDVARWLGSVWNGFVGTARNIWGKVVGGIKSAFGSVESFFKGVWYRVERIFAGAVNFITQDILNPIIRVLDDVLHVFGVNIKPIGRMVVSAPPNPANAGKSYGSGTGHGTGGGRQFAFGGVEPGYAPGHDTRTVRVSPGEGMVVPEVVRMLGGPPFIDALNALSPRVRGAGGSRGDGSGFSLGGVLGRISHDIGSFATAWRNADRKALLGIVHGVRNVSASAAYHALRVAESPILRVLGHLVKGSFVDVLAHGVFNRLNSAIRDFIRGNAGSAIFAGSGVGGAGALAIWKNLRAVGMSPAQAAGVMGNMISESGLNPFIIQGGGTSMNPAAAGGGGYGLVQWTPGAKLIPYLGGRGPSIISEVQALAAQLSGKGPSPEGGAGAALRGARTPEQAADIFGLQYERYAGPPQGARSAQARQVYDRYSKYDTGGFLPPGLTAAFNGTGRPELVLTADQQKALFNRGKQVEFNTVINPAAHQSEAEIAAITANMMSFRLRSSGAGF